MTAPAADDARGQLIARLTEAQNQQHTSIPVPDGLYEHEIEDVIDALLPVVSRIADQRAAEELQKTADTWQWGAWAGAPRIAGDVVTERIATAQYVTDWLRARAARLAPPTEPKGQQA